MPLKLFDTADAIPEPLREHAIETKDGKFAVSEDEDVSGIKSKNEQLLGETKKERAARVKAEKELADIRAEREAAELDKAGLKDVKKKWQTEELEPIAKERDALKAKYLDRALTAELKSMLADLDVHDVDAAYRLLGGDFELGDDETPTLKSDPTADVKKHLEKQLNERYKYLLKGTQAAGGGAGGSKGSGAGGAKTPTQMTSEERRAFIETNGEAAFYDALTKEQTATLTKKAAA